MQDFISFKKKIAQKLYNLCFFGTIGKWPSTQKCLQIDLTSKCNLRCKGCFHFAAPPTPDLSDQEILEFLSAKHKKGTRKLWLYGGEPSLRANLFDQIDRWFIDIHIISNGIIKIDPKYDWKLWISLDGPKGINDSIRGKGCFDLVISNFQGDKRVGLVMTVNKTNYQYIPVMIQMVKDLGVDTISFTFYSPCEEEDKKEFNFSPEDLDNIETLLLDEMKKNGKYILLDPVTLKSLLYGKITSPKWNNRCYFAEVLFEGYYSNGQRKKCCNPNVRCPSCRIHPPHQFHTLMVTRQAPWRKYAFK